MFTGPAILLQSAATAAGASDAPSVSSASGAPPRSACAQIPNASKNYKGNLDASVLPDLQKHIVPGLAQLSCYPYIGPTNTDLQNPYGEPGLSVCVMTFLKTPKCVHVNISTNASAIQIMQMAKCGLIHVMHKQYLTDKTHEELSAVLHAFPGKKTGFFGKDWFFTQDSADSVVNYLNKYEGSMFITDETKLLVEREKQYINYVVGDELEHGVMKSFSQMILKDKVIKSFGVTHMGQVVPLISELNKLLREAQESNQDLLISCDNWKKKCKKLDTELEKSKSQVQKLLDERKKKKELPTDVAQALGETFDLVEKVTEWHGKYFAGEKGDYLMKDEVFEDMMDEIVEEIDTSYCRQMGVLMKSMYPAMVFGRVFYMRDYYLVKTAVFKVLNKRTRAYTRPPRQDKKTTLFQMGDPYDYVD
jgi:hypothetical protein